MLRGAVVVASPGAPINHAALIAVYSLCQHRGQVAVTECCGRGLRTLSDLDDVAVDAALHDLGHLLPRNRARVESFTWSMEARHCCGLQTSRARLPLHSMHCTTRPLPASVRAGEAVAPVVARVAAQGVRCVARKRALRMEGQRHQGDDVHHTRTCSSQE